MIVACVQAMTAVETILQQEKKGKRKAMKQVLEYGERAAVTLLDPSPPTPTILAAKVLHLRPTLGGCLFDSSDSRDF